MPQSYPVTVVIRTKDIESRFSELLSRLSHQTLKCAEIVIIDNFSSRKKLEEMQCFLFSVERRLFDDRTSIKLVPLTDGEFSYPYSANVGVFVASSELVCIVNGHSLPSSDSWLEIGAAHFISPLVAAVGGYFTSHEDGTFWEKLVYDWWWKRRNEITKAFVEDNYFSTVNCILRRSLWKSYPFDEKLPVEIPLAKRFGGEDYDWAEEMQARGYKLVVEPRFNVCHSHQETFAQLVQKYLVWRRIRKQIRHFRRPRSSYTRLERIRPSYYSF